MRRSNEHHYFHPKSDYSSKLERAFYRLPCNRAQIDYHTHMLLHKYGKLTKPSPDEMSEAIRRHRAHECGCARGQLIVLEDGK